MQDDKLKELIQAVLDGKELQWDFYYEKDRTGWKNYVNKQGVQSLLKTVLIDLGNVAIRIKPEVSTFKYKTRPYSYVFNGTEYFDVWSGTAEPDYVRLEREGIKWLAPATEYEVEIND